MDYSHFSTDDFITDSAFISWVKSPTESNQKFWTDWLQQHPEKEQTVLEAKQFILDIDFSVKKPSPARKKIMLDRIHQEINLGKSVQHIKMNENLDSSRPKAIFNPEAISSLN